MSVNQNYHRKEHLQALDADRAWTAVNSELSPAVSEPPNHYWTRHYSIDTPYKINIKI